MGLGSHVAGIPDISTEPHIDRKVRRYMGDAAIYAYHAARKALADAGLPEGVLSSDRAGVIVGSGVGSPFQHSEAIDTLRAKGLQKVPPYVVPRVMGSTTSGCLATAFGVRGVSYSISSACATSAHCIGHGAELIQFGKQDVVIAGGAEEVRWTSTFLFDGMGALSTAFNDSPATASRPYDRDRDGFVIAGGSGILVLESLDHARSRGARIHAEIAGYGASSDGQDMVVPSVEGAARAMRMALAGVDGPIDYVNTHATSTRLGDLAEVQAMQRVFGGRLPPFSSTKGLTGHAIAASGAQEAIFSILMMRENFVAGSPNIDRIDADFADLPLVTRACPARLETVLTNSFGFGGTNACLVLRRVI